jgi:hypothetical protein
MAGSQNSGNGLLRLLVGASASAASAGAARAAGGLGVALGASRLSAANGGGENDGQNDCKQLLHSRTILSWSYESNCFECPVTFEGIPGVSSHSHRAFSKLAAKPVDRDGS